MSNVTSGDAESKLRFAALFALVLTVVVCSYGIRTQLTEQTQKLPQSVEKRARTFGHISQVFLSLKTAIFIDSEDVQKRQFKIQG